MNKEIWKGLIYQGNDYSDFLEVSNLGNIRNANTKHIYKLHIGKTGYFGVCISLGSRKSKKLFKAHKAVAETFIDNPFKKPIINHIDCNKTNNHINNLEWVTYKENTEHAMNNGLLKNKKGYESKIAKLTKEDYEYIKNNYIPKDKEFGCRALSRKFNVSHTSVLLALKYIKNNIF